ncbi:MAG: hypothetical protein R2736_23085 [Solirubrobacterales bacterium]
MTRIEGIDGPEIAGVYYLDDIVAQPLAFVDGAVLCPDGPGLGIEVDEDKLRHYAQAAEVPVA